MRSFGEISSMLDGIRHISSGDVKARSSFPFRSRTITDGAGRRRCTSRGYRANSRNRKIKGNMQTAISRQMNERRRLRCHIFFNNWENFSIVEAEKITLNKILQLPFFQETICFFAFSRQFKTSTCYLRHYFILFQMVITEG